MTYISILRPNSTLASSIIQMASPALVGGLQRQRKSYPTSASRRSAAWAGAIPRRCLNSCGFMQKSPTSRIPSDVGGSIVALRKGEPELYEAQLKSVLAICKV